MIHNIALQFEDGVTEFVKCKDGEKLSDAAYLENISIPIDCRDGACGTCRGLCETGTYNMPKSTYIEDALTDEEASNNYILTCQMIPTSDCLVQIPVTSAACKVKVKSYTGSLKSLEKISNTTIAFSLSFDNAHEFNFLAGQYVNLYVPNSEDSRSYSLSSAPGARDASFIVRNVPNGKMSSYLVEIAKIGEKMKFTGPYGNFYLRPISRPTLFIAGGTGIAPFLSMLDVIKEHNNAESIRMVFGVTSDIDLVEIDSLDNHAKNLPDFKYRTCVTDEKSDHPRKGYVTGHIDDTWLNGGDVDIYLCGPGPMVEAVRTWLDKKGIKPTGFYHENFSAS